MTTTTTTCALDEAVDAVCRRLDGEKLPAPNVLYLMATGVELFAEHLRDPREVALAAWKEVPGPWRAATLVTGRLGGFEAWLLDDVSEDPPGSGEPRAPWLAGFPVWLAAARGASVCLHTSAGSALPAGDGSPSPVPGGFAVLRDHMNLSGDTPLRGLGESRLGPLFPDQAHVHHLGLRRAALERAEKLGLRAAEAVAACTAGPALETDAERRMLARLGAEVSVQGLASPLLAAAHAGLAVLAIVAVTDAGEGSADVVRLLQRAASAQPALDDLLLALTEDLERAVRARGAEETA